MRSTSYAGLWVDQEVATLPLTLIVSLSANPVLLNTLNSTTVREIKLSMAPLPTSEGQGRTCMEDT